MVQRRKQKIIDGVVYQLCACGTCGEYFVAGKTTHGTEKKYINRHYWRGKEGSFAGHFHSKETKKKQSDGKVGHIVSKETRQKLREVNIGKKMNKETIEKIRKGNTGKVRTEEMKQRMRQPRSEETKQKMRKPKTGIHRLRISEAKKGDKNPSWQGGIAYLPYSQDWTEDLRDAIRKRDAYACKLCGIYQGNLEEKLHVHHIDYDKENCDPVNLVSLCNSCHGKTCHNKEKWESFFNGHKLLQRRTKWKTI